MDITENRSTNHVQLECMLDNLDERCISNNANCTEKIQSEQQKDSNKDIKTLIKDTANEDFFLHPSTPVLLQRRNSFILENLPSIAEWRLGLQLFCDSDEPPVVLVDMDNTIVNWESQFERLMARHHPQIPIVPPPLRTEFKIELNYEDEYRGPILHLTSLDEFWLSMDPVSGAVEAIKEMVSMGVVVFIVTTPDEKHTSRSAYEKIAWIEKHLGKEWKYRSILTHDKTLIKGDLLIDDKPSASVGLLQPSWTHVLYAQPYNRCLNCPRLDSWADWGSTIYRILIYRETQRREELSFYANICSTVSNEVRHQNKNSKQQFFTQNKTCTQNAESMSLKEKDAVPLSSNKVVKPLNVKQDTIESIEIHQSPLLATPHFNNSACSTTPCCSTVKIQSPIRNSLKFL